MAEFHSNLSWMNAAGTDHSQRSSSAPSQHHDEDPTTEAFFDHSTAKRVNTDTVIASALKKQYPNLELVISPASVNLLVYAQNGFATIEPIEDVPGTLPASLHWTQYIPPTRRLDGAVGGLAERALFAKYLYRWKDNDFIVYFVDGRDGTMAYPTVANFYILTSSKPKAHQLVLEAGRWTSDLHEEIWVYDQGYWQKSKELYDSIRNAEWGSVILNEDMKKSIIDDHMSFFEARETYGRLKVPWKRGIIYYGPPGNGKTISIKAMMHTLYSQKSPIPTLYVRSLASVRAISVVSLCHADPRIVYGPRVLNQTGLCEGQRVRPMLSGL
jgi:transitional endoplasmic reticulum ATPase